MSASHTSAAVPQGSIYSNTSASGNARLVAGNVYYQTTNNFGDESQPEQHFSLPGAVESHYLGREDELEALKRAFWQEDGKKKIEQKRYVVYGVGGSGKTQFCCKYAQDLQDKYWGVFWIDGTNEDRLKDSLTSNVAEKGGVAKNYEAARNWLAGQKRKWLLIIDNADDPKIDLNRFTPVGGNGHVLVSTRNQECDFGNVGTVCFAGMEKKQGRQLFLRCANVKDSAENKSTVSKILKELGYLALAVVVAGTTIKQDLYKLAAYLDHLREWWKSRRSRDKATAGDKAALQRCGFLSSRTIKLTRYYSEGRVEATFDISLDAIRNREARAIASRETEDETAARDAQELLRTFAFMHREKIRYSFLQRCVNVAKIESEAVETQSWKEYLFAKMISLFSGRRMQLVSLALPGVLREAMVSGHLDDLRLRRAMLYLRNYSLVSHDPETDSWSMHPLVHRWARESYDANIGEQHVWCRVAASVLSGCVILAAGQNSEDLMAQLLPHVSEVKKRHDELSQRIKDNQMGRDKWYPVLDWGPKRDLLRMYAKFSFVFISAGQYKQAETLQRPVHRALESLLGYESSKTRGMTIALASTLYALGRASEQAELLVKLLDNSVKIFGYEHRETLIATIKLADARLLQGQVLEARALCLHGVPGLEKHCGEEDEATLEALNIHAKAILLTGRSGAVQEAKEIYKRTWEIRERRLTAEHIDTLESRQLYYATSFWEGSKESHLEAEKGLEEIVQLLKRIRGCEHPLTLLAMLYLARVKVELQDFAGAQELFDYGLPIATRDLREEHMAVLFCRYHIGRMLVRQGRWLEARDILLDVSEKQCGALQGWGRFHYDRIGTLLELARAHQELGEYQLCDGVVEEAFEGFKQITQKLHPWEKRLRDQWEEWKRQRPTAQLDQTQSLS
ncbi:hypothetical protein Q7P37_002291 [Cladosporium fusiforme]